MNPIDKIHPSWKPIIDILNEDEELKKLNKDILPNCTYYPNRQDIFNVFSMDLKDIKVVILGQDPYPNEGQALGYAFAVSETTTKPASLRIIEKEVGHEIDKTLFNWRQQGVFLLNTALTVEAKKAGSHLKYWENFTKEVIKYISFNNPCIWLLWGAKAFQYEKYLGKENNILKAPHPAAEAYKSGAGYIGCKHFEIVNSILVEQNKEIINW